MLRLMAWMGAGVAALVWSLVSLVLFVIVSFVEGVFEGGARVVSMPLGGVDFGIGWLSDLLGDIGQVSVILLWLAGLAAIWFTKRLVTGRMLRNSHGLPPVRVHDAPQPMRSQHGHPQADIVRPAHAQPSAPTRLGKPAQQIAEPVNPPVEKEDFIRKMKDIAKGKKPVDQV